MFARNRSERAVPARLVAACMLDGRLDVRCISCDTTRIVSARRFGLPSSFAQARGVDGTWDLVRGKFS